MAPNPTAEADAPAALLPRLDMTVVYDGMPFAVKAVRVNMYTLEDDQHRRRVHLSYTIESSHDEPGYDPQRAVDNPLL